MADNTTMGSVTDVLRTVDLSGVKTGVSKLDVAAGAELLGLAAPDVVYLGAAGLTTASTAYTSGDQLGTEFTFPVNRAVGRGTVITHASLYDRAKILGAVDLVLFSASVTHAGDNAPAAWADAAIPIGVISFGAPTAFGNNSVARPTDGLPIVLKGGATINVYGVLVTRTGHTFFGAVNDIVVVLGTEPV